MDAELHQGGGQVLGHPCQQVPGEVELLHVLEGGEGFGVDLGDLVVDQGQGLGKVSGEKQRERERESRMHL